MSNEIKNYTDFRVAHLHNKFWTHNGLLVPNQKVILNEDFIDTNSLLRIPEQIKHFQIYWITKGIAGEVGIPGEWNYAYIDGKFYHAVKMHSLGLIDGLDEEWFMYNLIYDDWQNDWLNNTFYMKGTIELTGDPDLVRQNIHQTEPMLDNMNGYRFLNGVRKNTSSDYTTKIKYPATRPSSMIITGMSTTDKVYINDELQKFIAEKKPAPIEDRLVLPLVYRISNPGN